MLKYKRLTIFEREQISRLLAAGYSLRDIAKIIERAPSTMSREIGQSKVIHVKYYRIKGDVSLLYNTLITNKLQTDVFQ